MRCNNVRCHLTQVGISGANNGNPAFQPERHGRRCVGHLLLLKDISGPQNDRAQPLAFLSRAFHRAMNERQTDQLEAILDDNVDWAIYGPIDMFAFLGPRHGKRAVIDVVREISDIKSLFPSLGDFKGE